MLKTVLHAKLGVLPRELLNDASSDSRSYSIVFNSIFILLTPSDTSGIERTVLAQCTAWQTDRQTDTETVAIVVVYTHDRPKTLRRIKDVQRLLKEFHKKENTLIHSGGVDSASEREGLPPGSNIPTV
jgi:hypothetical protein